MSPKPHGWLNLISLTNVQLSFAYWMTVQFTFLSVHGNLSFCPETTSSLPSDVSQLACCCPCPTTMVLFVSMFFYLARGCFYHIDPCCHFCCRSHCETINSNAWNTDGRNPGYKNINIEDKQCTYDL